MSQTNHCFIKTLFSSLCFMLATISMLCQQRIVFPGQNQLYRFLEDPSYISQQKNYNMMGVVQASDSKMAQTSQYLVAQFSFFDNLAFGVDYSKHSFESYRYSHILFSTRARLELGSEYHYFNLGLSVGPDKFFQVDTADDNEISTTYRAALHYTNYDLSIGGFYNRYPLQTETLINNNVQIPTTTKGYSVYASYNIVLLNELLLTPMVRYNSYDDLNFFEGVATFNYKELFKMALSYKNDYSINPQLSAKIVKRVVVSYSYEKSMGSQTFKDVHAIGLSVDLGSKETDDPEWLTNVKKKNAKIKRIKNATKEEAIIAEIHEDPVIEEVIAVVTDDPSLQSQPMSENDPEDTINNQLKPGYYIVLGSFKILNNATKEVERLKNQGYYARIGKKSASDAFNYVYVDRYTDRAMAFDRLKVIKKEKGLDKTWVLIIE